MPPTYRARGRESPPSGPVRTCAQGVGDPRRGREIIPAPPSNLIPNSPGEMGNHKFKITKRMHGQKTRKPTETGGPCPDLKGFCINTLTVWGGCRPSDTPPYSGSFSPGNPPVGGLPPSKAPAFCRVGGGRGRQPSKPGGLGSGSPPTSAASSG